MISHDHKVIFIHIPKCAGTSVERFFGHWDGFDGSAGQDHRPVRMIEAPVSPLAALGSASDAKLYAKRFRNRVRKLPNPRNRLTVTPQQYRDYYKVAIVRDPWSRVLSWYRNVRNDPKHQQKHGIGPDLPFGTFVERFAGRGMIAPSEYWLRQFDGRIVMDREIRFDDLQAGFAAMCEDIGMAGETLPHHHSGGRKLDVAEAYDSRARDIVAERYAPEIARYGFTFDAALAETKPEAQAART